jgi:glycosyltransferase involved in cell wall biosynthesis
MGLKIAILGTRGIPNNYGGFEQIAACLSRGLIQKGHDVTVYNSSRHPYQEKTWHGVHIAHCFDPEYLVGVPGQFIYDFNCIMDARRRNYDIILMLGYTSSSIWGFLYPKKTTIITNMDGLEWRRTKYSKPVRSFLKLAEKLAIRSSHFYIADSLVIKEYLDNKFHIESRYISYGAELHPAADEKFLAEYDLRKNEYFLLMSRMEPENSVELILDGYCRSISAKKFIVIGNTGNKYGTYLVNKYKNKEGIIFIGAIFDKQKVQSITSFCSLYFHGHTVGGTNPSLLNAMAARVPLAIHNNPFNRSVVKGNALRFANSKEVCNLINLDNHLNEAHIHENYSRIENEYSWDRIIGQYENYFLECSVANKVFYQLKHEENILYK